MLLAQKAAIFLKITFIVFFNTADANLQTIIKLRQILHADCVNDTKNWISELRKEKGSNTCKPGLDRVFSCWGETEAGLIAESNCMELMYKSDGKTKRLCRLDGTWDITDRSKCERLSVEESQRRKADVLLKHELAIKKDLDAKKKELDTILLLSKLLFIFRCTDACVCLVGLVILSIFIPLKNVRFFLHRNLILTFFAYDVSEIILIKYLRRNHFRECTYVFFVSHYIFVCQIAWMTNEAVFIFRQLFFPFFKKKLIWAYILFGYGFPAIVVFGIFVPVILTYPPIKDFSVCWEAYNLYYVNNIIFITAYTLLSFNFLIMLYILIVIWKKLQQSPEEDKMKKTARGFIILSVLLGGGYIGALIGPLDSIAWNWFRTIINPTQGIMICIFHVIITRDVRKAVLNKIRLFKSQHESVFNASYLNRRKEDANTTMCDVSMNSISKHDSVKSNGKERSDSIYTTNLTETESEEINGKVEIQNIDQKNNTYN